MTKNELALWKKIQMYELDIEESNFTFTDRLARENNWSFNYAIRVILEYKKFMFLVCICKQPLTPSDQVDQVWHLHLLYTKSYWEEFCNEILQNKIHHGPTKGGKGEKIKFNHSYKKTKSLYKEIFNVVPPIDIWPSNKTRFAEINFVRINKDKFWVIPKIKMRWKWLKN